MQTNDPDTTTDSEGSVDAAAFAAQLEGVRAALEAGGASEPWAPSKGEPARPVGVPAEATWSSEAHVWRAGQVDGAGQRHGAWQFWAMNGALVGEREYAGGTEMRSIAYRPGKKIAARIEHDATADVTVHTSYRASGELHCVARYRGGNEMVKADEDVLEETYYRKDGGVIRSSVFERDAGGLVLYRTSGPNGVRFENARIAGGRELRFFAESDAAPVVIVRALDGEKPVARFRETGDAEIAFEGLELGEDTREDIEGALGGPLFAATVADLPVPDLVRNFVRANEWAAEVDDDAPFAHASVANFLTALGSPIPNVGDLGAVGLGLLVGKAHHPAVRELVVTLSRDATHARAARNAIERLDHRHGAPNAMDEQEEEEEEEEEAAGDDQAAECVLGKVTLPRGDLAIVDMGAMGQWSHDAPHHADISGGAWAAVVGAKRGDFFDRMVTGPDAKKALALFAKDNGAVLFDAQPSYDEDAQRRFADLIGPLGLRATLERSPVRFGHGARIRMLKSSGAPYASFGFAHVNVVCIFGLPQGKELSVVARRDEDDRWRYVSLVCKPTESVSREKVGALSIEEARFMFADPESLAHWEHERTLDGLHDFVIFSGHAESLAERFCVGDAYDGDTDYFGWADVPPNGLPPHALQALFDASERRELTFEPRPHTHHNAILRQAWNSENSAGSARVGDAMICGLFTSVGDGVFPVFVERDAAGEVCRVTVEITDSFAAGGDEDDDDDEDEDGDDTDE